MDHLSVIGFPVASLDAYQALAEKVFDRGHGYRAGENFYMRYHDPSGAELWLQVDLNQSFVGMNPHFDARSSMEVELEKAIQRHAGTMDGAFQARILPQGPSIIFDMPDAHMVPALRLPAQATLHLAAFARGPMRVSAQGQPAYRTIAEADPDSAEMLLSGQILSTETRHNQTTGHNFHWARLKVLGGAMELLSGIDPEAANWKVGMWLEGKVWLSGRVEVAPQKQVPAGFLERLFWGA